MQVKYKKNRIAKVMLLALIYVWLSLPYAFTDNYSTSAEIELRTRLLFSDQKDIPIYSCPRRVSDRIGLISTPAEIVVIKEQSDFVYIRTFSGKYGWILKRNVDTGDYRRKYKEKLKEASLATAKSCGVAISANQVVAVDITEQRNTENNIENAQKINVSHNYPLINISEDRNTFSIPVEEKEIKRLEAIEEIEDVQGIKNTEEIEVII